MELCVVCSGKMRHTLSLNKDSFIGFCMLSTLRSRSRHLLSALLPFTTFMHYKLIQINHDNCFTSFLMERCMSCTLKSNGSILSTILMMTLMLIISFIKAICFLTTRTQQYHYIENCLSLKPWGSDNPFLSAMMFTLLLTFNSSFLKGLLFILISIPIEDPLSPMSLIYGNCGACILSVSWCN